jgi:hypothetical protein
MHDVDAKQTPQWTREPFPGEAISPQARATASLGNPNAAESERLTPRREGRTS